MQRLTFRPSVLLIDRRLAVREVAVYTADRGVIVDNPVTTPPFCAYITSWHSGLRISPIAGKTQNGIEMEQSGIIRPIWSMWEVTLKYQNGRTPNSYKVKLRNLQSNKYMIVKGGSHEQLTSITQWKDEGNDNSVWNVDNAASPSEFYRFTLQNENTKGYAVIQGGSTDPGAKIVQWNTGGESNSKWGFEKLAYDTPLETGYYKIKNRHSSKYLGLYSDFLWARQVSEPSRYMTDIVWRIEKRAGGVYTLTNMFRQKSLVTDFLKYSSSYPYTYITDIDDEYGIVGTTLWQIKREGDRGYLIIQEHMGKQLGVQSET